MSGPEEFFLAVAVERALCDVHDLNNCIHVSRAVSERRYVGEGVLSERFQVGKIGVVEHLNAGGTAKVQLGCVAKTSNLSAINFQERADLVVEGLPRQEPNRPGVVGQATPNNID